MSTEAVRTTPPQIHDRSTTGGIMWTTVAALIPAAVWGVLQYGLPAVLVFAASIATAIACEIAAGAILKRQSLRDGHGILIGFLIALGMPAGVPLGVPVVAVTFALIVVKWSFGGLGAYWMNPAAAGWVFAYFSFPQFMQRPGADATSSASVLELSAQARLAGEASNGPLAAAVERGYSFSNGGSAVTEWLNANVLSGVGIDLPDGYVDLFLGFSPGAIGEGSVLLLLLGTLILFGRRIIRWEIPVSLFVSFAVFVRVFGGLSFGVGLFHGDVLFHLFAGGLVMSMFYIAPEMGSAPYTRLGMIIYGSLIGALAGLFRVFGTTAEGIAFAVVVGSAFGPLINRYTQPRRFGVRGRVHDARREDGT